GPSRTAQQRRRATKGSVTPEASSPQEGARPRIAEASLLATAYLGRTRAGRRPPRRGATAGSRCLVARTDRAQASVILGTRDPRRLDQLVAQAAAHQGPTAGHERLGLDTPDRTLVL